MQDQDTARYVVQAHEAPICDGGGTKYAVIDTQAEYAPGIVHDGPFYKETRDEQLARRWADELNEQEAATEQNIADAEAVALYDEPAIPLAEALAGAEEKRAARKLAGEQAAGLRALADMIEANPDVAHLLLLAVDSMSAYVTTAEDMAAFTRAAAAAKATVTKDYPKDADRHMSVTAGFGPVAVRLHTTRDVVCKRVVTGVETVTKTVPDPALLAAVPLVDVTEEVEQVRWECRPLLAAESTVGGA